MHSFCWRLWPPCVADLSWKLTSNKICFALSWKIIKSCEMKLISGTFQPLLMVLLWALDQYDIPLGMCFGDCDCERMNYCYCLENTHERQGLYFLICTSNFSLLTCSCLWTIGCTLSWKGWRITHRGVFLHWVCPSLMNRSARCFFKRSVCAESPSITNSLSFGISNIDTSNTHRHFTYN